MGRFGKEEKRELEGFDKRQRNNLKRLIYNRIFRSLANSKDVDTIDMARIAKLGAEVLDKIASVDLKEAQRDEIVRKILTGTRDQSERVVVQIVYPNDPPEPSSGGDSSPPTTE